MVGDFGSQLSAIGFQSERPKADSRRPKAEVYLQYQIRITRTEVLQNHDRVVA